MNTGIGKRWMYGRRGYALVFSWRHLTARPLASALNLTVLGITLALPLLLVFSAKSLSDISAKALDGETLTLYLDPALSVLEGAALAETLSNRPGVRATRYISPDEALQSLTEHTDIADTVSLLGGNPLPGAIVVHPAAGSTDDSQVAALGETLARIDEVERVQYDLRWVRRLQAVVALVRVTAGLLAGFLVLTALLVIANTIRLELLRRQAESDVAYLLGASAAFRHRSFLYTGAIHGLLGGLVGIVLALPMLYSLQRPSNELARLYGSEFRLPTPSVEEVLLVLVATTLLGLLGAATTLVRSSRDLFRNGRSR